MTHILHWNFKVQFRLKQIVDAEPEVKENLLKELEEFAFRGIPDFQKTMKNIEETKGTENFEVMSVYSSFNISNYMVYSQIRTMLPKWSHIKLNNKN